MKPIKLNEARKILLSNSCVCLRTGRHEIWKNNKTNQTFALPGNHQEISPGVLRKMFRFIKGN